VKGGTALNLLHVKYAVEVARLGSLNKAAETLMIAQPNISRSIKELEADLGITIFQRSAKGMVLTPEGEEFLDYARDVLSRIDKLERSYRDGSHKKRKFSISVPRACYISSAIAEFSKTIGDAPAEIYYKETNSKKTVHMLLENECKLGIIRYAENYDKHYKSMLEEKGLVGELVAEFSYVLIMSRDHPLASKETITYDDLSAYIEIAHADPYVPTLSMSKVFREELPDKIGQRIFVYERASQFDLLSENPKTFMWVSPASQQILDRYNLVQRVCEGNKKVYKDVLIYHKGYRLSKLDKDFVTALCEARRKFIK
jgi:DNA-binding transcriptional LysR family regulator